MQTIALENKRGFTLIELVMVIVIIGILAAVLLPKFANLNVQAYDSLNRGAGGGLTTAVGVAHAAWEDAGSSTSGGTVTLNGNTVYMSSQGWPNGFTSASGGAAVTNANGCQKLWNVLVPNPPQAALAVSSCTGTAPCYVITYASGSCIYILYTGGPTGQALVPSVTVTYVGATGSVTIVP